VSDVVSGEHPVHGDAGAVDQEDEGAGDTSERDGEHSENRDNNDEIKRQDHKCVGTRAEIDDVRRRRDLSWRNLVSFLPFDPENVEANSSMESKDEIQEDTIDNRISLLNIVKQSLNENVDDQGRGCDDWKEKVTRKVVTYVEVKVDIVMPDHPENTDNNKIDDCQEIVKVQVLVNHFKIPII